MSFIRRIRRWLAGRSGPAEPGPDNRDLNLGEPGDRLHQSDRSTLLEADPAEQQRRLARLHARYRSRSGPWQQK